MAVRLPDVATVASSARKLINDMRTQISWRGVFDTEKVRNTQPGLKVNNDFFMRDELPTNLLNGTSNMITSFTQVGQAYEQAILMRSIFYIRLYKIRDSKFNNTVQYPRGESIP